MIIYKPQIVKKSSCPFINWIQSHWFHLDPIIVFPMEHNIAGKSASTNVELDQCLKYRNISNINRSKSQNLNDSRLIL